MIDDYLRLSIGSYLLILMIFGFACSHAVDQTIDDAVLSAVNRWKPHDETRPRPPVIHPGHPSTLEQPGDAPSDAVVLFDGSDLSQWQMADGDPPEWKLGKGFFEVIKGTGTLQTKGNFGDCQLHVEWASPVRIQGEGQGRGNSGVFFMGRYEIQVLDSYDNVTYADGQAAAVYGQYPPLVNASLPPGEWQAYDIVFHRPRFDDTGKLYKPARITVFHNGVLVQDDVELVGPTAHKTRPPYEPHPDRLPIQLQDHGNPVRYRNIWIRDLENREQGSMSPEGERDER